MIQLATERGYFGQGYQSVAGLDEAGRGPLAGPVVAASFLLRPEDKLPPSLRQVNDSKRLTPLKRQQVFEAIEAAAWPIGVGIVEPGMIDKLNILQATFLAMRQAVAGLSRAPGLVLVDGPFEVAGLGSEQRAVVRGDQSVFAIAAASIVAKVVRDRLMEELHRQYPRYGFDRHKGYGTKEHLRALALYGPCPSHRLSFAPVARAVRAAC